MADRSGKQGATWSGCGNGPTQPSPQSGRSTDRSLCLNEFERDQIFERTAAALRHKKQQHQACSPTPYGYDRVGDMLVVNDRKQTVLERIRALRAADWSLERIAAEQNKEGIPAKKGGVWCLSSVRSVLQTSGSIRSGGGRKPRGPAIVLNYSKLTRSGIWDGRKESVFSFPAASKTSKVRIPSRCPLCCAIVIVVAGQGRYPLTKPQSHSEALWRLRAATSVAPLDPKRRHATSGRDEWYPYYAGFSSSFARSVLREFRGHHGLVLDPWNGSGTTTTTALELGMPSVGFDLNPAAVLIAKAKRLALDPSQRADLIRTCKQFMCEIPAACAKDDPLMQWLPQVDVAHFRTIEANILSHWCSAPASEDDETTAAFCMVSLIRAAKTLASKRRASNPTWVRPDQGESFASAAVGRLGSQFVSLVETHVRQALLNAGDPTRVPCRIEVGDARDLDLQDDSVSIVLTSPPYLTRLDYAVSMSFELSALGYREREQEYQDLRASMMGTTKIRREAERLPDCPHSIRQLIDRIANHDSYASSGYYRKNITQYFQDAQRGVTEIMRVMQPGGVALFVLQTSYYKEIEIDLGGLYMDLLDSQGHWVERLCRLPVTRVMSSLHGASPRTPKREYFEDVILATKQPL